MAMKPNRDVQSSFAAAAALCAILLQSAPCAADPNLDVPVTATAPSAPPIEIDTCLLKYSGNVLIGTSDGIQIKFTNNSAQVADMINFRVAAGSETGVIRDVGTFSPGIEITHNYKEGSGQEMVAPILSHTYLQCSVESVHFKNGAVWQPAAATASDAAAPASPLTASRASLTFAETGSNFDQFITIEDQVAMGSLKEVDNCGGI